MPHWTKEQGKEALGAVSKLKRALGIANHPSKQDEFIEDRIHIYTSDAESAQLIAELLYRFGNGPREAFYNARPDLHTIRDTIKLIALEEGGYDVKMWIPYPPKLTKSLQKMVDKHIAPDTRYTR